jgi:hypothetical protein
VASEALPALDDDVAVKGIDLHEEYPLVGLFSTSFAKSSGLRRGAVVSTRHTSNASAARLRRRRGCTR